MNVKVAASLSVLTMILILPLGVQGQKFHLEYGPKRHVSVLQVLDRQYINGDLKDLHLMLGKPPVMPGRQNLVATIDVDGYPAVQEIQGTEEWFKVVYQRYFWPAGTRHAVIRFAYNGTLQTCRIAPGPSAQPVLPLTAAEVKQFLKENRELDLKSPVVQKFMEDNGLMRQPGEQDIDLAWRLFSFISRRYKYGGGPEHILSKLLLGPGSDCGGISQIFTGMCRFSGIPARLLGGRLLDQNGLAKDNDEGSYHCQSECFIKGIGWLPVDATYGLQAGERAMQYFGNRETNLIVTTFDVDIPFEKKDQSGKVIEKTQLAFLQGFWIWEGGGGKNDEAKEKKFFGIRWD